mmetsp:Transcript_141087/g.249232  ORF Transcript_141087/g.249232 Transcript_141087/m.249232 type:complete len:207 (+) Transcript_141087:53-673(+)
MIIIVIIVITIIMVIPRTARPRRSSSKQLLPQSLRAAPAQPRRSCDTKLARRLQCRRSEVLLPGRQVQQPPWEGFSEVPENHDLLPVESLLRACSSPAAQRTLSAHACPTTSKSTFAFRMRPLRSTLLGKGIPHLHNLWRHATSHTQPTCRCPRSLRRTAGCTHILNCRHTHRLGTRTLNQRSRLNLGLSYTAGLRMFLLFPYHMY